MPDYLLWGVDLPTHLWAWAAVLDSAASRGLTEGSAICSSICGRGCFELWCWRRLLRVPWTARRSNQSIIKEISPGCSLEGLILKLNSNTLATSCEELTHWKRPWCSERLKAGGEGDDRGWDGWMASLTQWTRLWASSESWWWTGRPGVLQSMGLQRVGHNWVTELNLDVGEPWVSWERWLEIFRAGEVCRVLQNLLWCRPQHRTPQTS